MDVMRVSQYLLVFSVGVCQAQLQTFEYANTTIGSGGFVRFNNFAALGQKNEEKLDYTEVRGRCWWDPEWNSAVLILKNGKTTKLKKVRLNFYTNDIHYVDNAGVELVAQNRIAKIIFFDRSDTTKALAVFQNLEGFKIKNVDSYAQVLFEGRIQLLKRTEVTLKKENEPMLGRAELKFMSQEHYYIQKSADVFPLKKISKANLFEVIKATDEDEAWLRSNKNKLKNETEVISFLNHSYGRK